MGTRGLLGLIIQGKRHGAYNHWDSYPKYMGQKIVEFILDLKPEEWDSMAARAREIEWVEQGSRPSEELQKKYNDLGFADVKVSGRTLADWYCLLYKVQGAAALPAIQRGDLKHLVEAVTFLEDSLFCEWAYFIDFENRKLETWKPPQMLDEVSFEDLTAEYTDRILKKSRVRVESSDEEEVDEEEGDEEEGDEDEGDEESEESEEQANSGDESK